MTTKHKIISGFACVVLTLAVVAALGYRALDEAVDEFGDFSRNARVNVLCTKVLILFTEAAIAFNRYVDGYDDEIMKEAMDRLVKVDKTLEEAPQYMRMPANIALVNDSRQKAQEFKQELDKVQAAGRILLDVYRSKVIPSRTAMMKELEIITNVAHEMKNENVLRAIVLFEAVYADVRFATATYISARSDEDAKSIEKDMAILAAEVTGMRQFIRAPLALEAHDKLVVVFKVWGSAYEEMFKAGREANRVINEARRIRLAVSNDLGKLSENFDNQMNTTEQVTHIHMQQGQKTLLMGSGAGLALGLLASFVIITGLAKVLRETSAFALSIADGDFDAQVHSAEKGEIGDMLGAMRSIPKVLTHMTGDFHKLQQQIQSGKLDAKISADEYHGGFAAMLEETNSILDRYIHIVDSLPSPLLMLNKELKLAFMNEIGRKLAGGDYKGKADVQISKREDADGPNDALLKAANTLKTVSAETIAHPMGMNMDIQYTNVPLLDHDGKLASVLQLVMDLTVVKTAQRTMNRVAERAREISDRVASASEQLSTQVEQVSRGAEEQHGRVEITLTAMSEMNSTVLEVARNAGQASDQSETTKNKARDGADLVNKVVQS
ncbi:MAG: PAS domain-containing protein, partial [Deltaproteobacteria bacterium]|nr:PAS domain-containing protein [Deltaproteobacteria bacterium]